MPQEGSGNVREILQYFGDYQLLQCIMLHSISHHYSPKLLGRRLRHHRFRHFVEGVQYAPCRQTVMLCVELYNL
jgi:hypothetical protein